MGKTKILAAAAAVACLGTGAMAASVTIDSITASFGTPTPGNVVGLQFDATGQTGANTDPGTASIFWGTPTANGNGQKSGYQFVPTATPFAAPAMPGDILSLGTFTHFNFPISGNTTPASITGVPLNFSFAGTPLGGSQETFPATFNFIHDETLNEAPCSQPSPTPCSDLVSFVPVGGADEVVTVGNTVYTFSVLGFGENVGGVPNFIDPNAPFLFVTTENQANSTDLWFTYSVEVVPLPAAGWLLLAGLGALGAAGRRRKSA